MPQEISGRWLVLTTVGVGVAMAVGGWWYHYEAARRTAVFWGTTGANLLLEGKEVEALELAPLDRSSGGDRPKGDAVAGRAVVARHDLTEAPGLIHLRFALTQDDDYDWAAAPPPADDIDWALALRFRQAEDQLVVLLSRDFQWLGKLDRPDSVPAIVACPRMASALREYLGDVGAIGGAAPAPTR